VRVTLPSGTPAELAVPEGADPAGVPSGGLVLLPDIMGLRPLFDGHAQRLADALGWTVCVPEPWPGREDLPLADRLESVGSLDDAAVIADAAAAADRTGAASVAVLGFCMGGMYALKAAASGRFDKAVSFYGMIRVPENWESPTQAQPLDLLAAELGLAVVEREDLSRLELLRLQDEERALKRRMNELKRELRGGRA
jgi:carboxymethylenebutenolidase